ncbi:MAG TPA: hypothetical protein DDY17_04050 [Syntrophaceae bacterium]|jgi:hypothetical protein|nr:hypothetical protein [Syntrophaceae bacterium]
MNPLHLNHIMTSLRFLTDFERALTIITRGEKQIEAVDRVKGGEADEDHGCEQRSAEGIENIYAYPDEQDGQ